MCAVSVLLATRPKRAACPGLVQLRSAFPSRPCNPRSSSIVVDDARRAGAPPWAATGFPRCDRRRQCFVRQNPCSTLARRPKSACCGDYPQALLFRVTGRCTVPEWTQQSLDRVGSHGQPPCSRRRGRSTVGGLLKTRCHRYELTGWPAGLLACAYLRRRQPARACVLSRSLRCADSVPNASESHFGT